jgi:hypothetical protein
MNASTPLAAGVLAAYYAVLLPLALFGLHRIYLLWLSRRGEGLVPGGTKEGLVPGGTKKGHVPGGTKKGHVPGGTKEGRVPGTKDVPETNEAPAGSWPRVLVQLPIYNERYVAQRLIGAVAELDYPSERLEIQVLDDSTDDTTALVAETVGALRGGGLDIRHLRRFTREGYKAGALAQGLRHSDAELVAVFDADFVPSPDFLRRTVPELADPTVGMVQACWTHLNRDASLLTRVQALLLDGHFLVEQVARAAGGLLFNFNGTAGLWRRAAIDDAGGWQHDTLTEDLDLSYRAQLRGWRFVFQQETKVAAELPIDLAAFRSQQRRWTRGSAQTLRKLGWAIVRGGLPRRQKLQALLHLSANLCYPLLVALGVLLLPAMVARALLAPPALVVADLLALSTTTVAVSLFYLQAARRAGTSRWRAMALLPALMALGIGMSWHNARAALGGLWQKGGTFERTPKHATGAGKGAWRQSVYAARRSPRMWPELLLCTALGIGLGVALFQQLLWAVPFQALFFSGYLYVVTLAWSSRARPEREVAAGEARLDLAT